MTHPIQDRRGGPSRRSSTQRSLLRRILFAEFGLVFLMTALGFVLAYLIFVPAPAGGLPGSGGMLIVMALLAVTAMVAVVAAVRVSSRISGPVVKIRRALIQIARGDDPGRVNIRHDDEFHDLVDALNGALESVRRRQALGMDGVSPVGAEVLSIVSEKRAGGPEAESSDDAPPLSSVSIKS